MKLKTVDMETTRSVRRTVVEIKKLLLRPAKDPTGGRRLPRLVDDVGFEAA